MKFTIEQLTRIFPGQTVKTITDSIFATDIDEQQIPLEHLLTHIAWADTLLACATHPNRSLAISYGTSLVLPVANVLIDPRSVAAIQIVVQALQESDPSARGTLIFRAEQLARKALHAAEEHLAFRQRLCRVPTRDPVVPAAKAVLLAVQGKPHLVYECVLQALPSSQEGTADAAALTDYNAYCKQQLLHTSHLANLYD